MILNIVGMKKRRLEALDEISDESPDLALVQMHQLNDPNGIWCLIQKGNVEEIQKRDIPEPEKSKFSDFSFVCTCIVLKTI